MALEISKNNKIQLTLLTLYVLVFAAINLSRIGLDDLWLDEVLSVDFASRDWGVIIAKTAADVHPPLYYFILKIFMLAFGRAHYVYRIASLMPYLLTCIWLLVSGRKRYGYAASAVFITLISINEYVIEYNVQVRMYSWAAFFALMACVQMEEIIRDGKAKDYILFTLFVLLAAYTHYYALLTVGFLFLGLIIWSLKNRKNVGRIFICAAVDAALYIPWIIVYLSSSTRITDGGFWIDQTPTIRECVDMLLPFPNRYYKAVVLAAFLFVIAYPVCRKAMKDKNAEIDFAAYISLASVILTVATGKIVSRLLMPCLVDRYLYPACMILWWVISRTVARDRNGTEYKHMPNVYVCILAMIFIMAANFRSFSDKLIKDREYNTKFSETVDYIRTYDPSETVLYSDSFLNVMKYYFPDYNNVVINSQDPVKTDEDMTNIIMSAWIEPDVIEKNIEGEHKLRLVKEGVFSTNITKVYLLDD